MGSKRAAPEKKIAELTRKTNLSKEMVQRLVANWQAKCKDKGLDRDTMRGDLMNEFNMLDDFILDRIFRTFDVSATGLHLKMEDYVLGMAKFLKGTPEEQRKFCFDVYDLNGDGYITREEVMHLLKNSVVQKSIEDDDEEGTKDLTDLILKKLDCDDHDGRVSFKDFCTAVQGDKLLMESLGQCLPAEEV
ncbi:hypothetical protein C0Q70_09500 [Pomacea canaliculata]|uniref:EF-hand domain-containing protein n=1 Tax=Pomacea canaliculata TaxID=400727 RepID=A0A2T7P9Z1_POMCA|nr:hypothetical protein C0Q70_09500 [Pomacea canaliculata]